MTLDELSDKLKELYKEVLNAKIRTDMLQRNEHDLRLALIDMMDNADEDTPMMHRTRHFKDSLQHGRDLIKRIKE